ncbi:TIGR03089 family protein [Neomicrococcus lactis]
MTANPETFAEHIFGRLRHQNHPALVWYSADGERIELSGRVVDNWVAKSANFLVEQFDAAPGETVGVQAPLHWKSLAFAFAVLQSGATLAGPDRTNLDVLFTDRPELADELNHHGETLVVTLPSLAFQYPGDLAAHLTDYSAEVRAFADYFAPQPVPADAIAIDALSGQLTYAAFMDAVTARMTALQHDAAASPEVPLVALMRAETLGSTPDYRTALVDAAAVWVLGGTVVLVGDGKEVTDRIRSDERIVIEL